MARRLKAHDPTKKTRRKPEPVETRQIAHPRIWATTMRIADGNMSQIKVESHTRVTVTSP